MATIKLYDYSLSGNCYKVRLLLSMLGVDYQKVAVDLAGGETMTDEFMAINPRGQVPVLVDGETTIWDSMAILTYLARVHGDEKWFPQAPELLAQVMQWLAVSENELLYGLARARATLIFKRPFNLEQCQEEGHMGLNVMDKHLSKHKWLASDNVTIADIACYPYISFASEGEVSVDEYKHVMRWMNAIEQLPAWVPNR